MGVVCLHTLRDRPLSSHRARVTMPGAKPAFRLCAQPFPSWGPQTSPFSLTS